MIEQQTPTLRSLVSSTGRTRTGPARPFRASPAVLPNRSRIVERGFPERLPGNLDFREIAGPLPAAFPTSHPIPSGKRVFDIALASLLLVLLSPVLLLLSLLVKLTSKGPALYWSDRVGLENEIFRMPKFRSMRVDTPEVAPHLLRDAKAFLSPIGSFLRKSSLDELPQLWSIFRGHLSFVGPRPALYNEAELIALRTRHGVHRIVPGLTGWAQINGRNNLSMTGKVGYDAEYASRRSLRFDIRILSLTVKKVARREDITH
jgi:O-antigen biosynthesis protein WbqP